MCFCIEIIFCSFYDKNTQTGELGCFYSNSFNFIFNQHGFLLIHLISLNLLNCIDKISKLLSFHQTVFVSVRPALPDRLHRFSPEKVFLSFQREASAGAEDEACN